MANSGNIIIRPLGQIAAAMARVGQNLYQSPGNAIRDVDPKNWPTALQPVQPLGPKGSEPLGWPFWYGQNLMYTPRPDAVYAASDLRLLSTYPLARICIENTKDQLCQLSWKVQLRQMPGETRKEIRDRRKRDQRGDASIKDISAFLEYPDGEHDWGEWLRPILDDMLVIDAASVLVRKTYSGKLAELRWVPGDNITRYIDDNGFTPKPPSPAYAQLWEGVPRVNLDSTQLMYKPRNIVPRNTISSYLYGYSPAEQLADEIKIGIARLAYVMRYYDKGSIGNAIQVVPPNVTVDKIREMLQFVNSEMSGNLAARREWHMIQGFAADPKNENILFPKEPVLADIFDDLHIRKLCFGFGTSPQRLQRMMNRASAVASQQAAEDEGIRPWKTWIEKSIGNPIVQRMSGSREYEMILSLAHDEDELKDDKIQAARVDNGRMSLNEARDENGDDAYDDPAADELAIRTQAGRVPIGFLMTKSGPIPEDSGIANIALVPRGDTTPAPKPKPNGRA